jgi:hypothetical protein
MELLAMAAKKAGLKIDGYPTENRGPCKCGFRHWCDGVEYDYAFMFDTPDGPKALGYNLADNPYLVAQTFVEKHNLAANTLNDRPIVTLIANKIMDHTATNSAPNVDKKSTFDPYKAQLNVNTLSSHYNKVTGKFEKATYHVEDKLRKIKEEEEAEARERKRREEEVSRHMREVEIEQEKDRIAKEQLKEKIRLDALEREADKRYTPDQDSVARPVSRPKSTMTGGVKTLNDMNSSSATKNKTPNSNSNIRNLANTNNNDDMDTDSDSDSDSEEEFEREMSKFSREYTGDVTADKWDNPKLLIAKYNQLGVDKLEEEMIKSGVDAEKAKSNAMFAQILALQIEIVKAKKKEQKRNKKAAMQFMRQLQNMKGSGSDMFNSPSPKAINRNETPISPKFSQGGFKLGGSSNNVPPPVDAAPSAGQEARDKQPITVDATQPQTTIQVRLGNGQKLSIQANHTHTVQQIRDHIDSVSGITDNYELMMSFPRKVLNDLAQTVQQAGLINAAIIQTLK